MSRKAYRGTRLRTALIAGVAAVALVASACATSIVGEPTAGSLPEVSELPEPPTPPEEPDESDNGAEDEPAEPPIDEPDEQDTFDPAAPIVTATLLGTGSLNGQPGWDNAGHVIVPLRNVDGFDGTELFAVLLHGPDTPFDDDDALTLSWHVPYANDCGFDAGLDGIVVAPLWDADAEVPVVHIGVSDVDLVNRNDFSIETDPLVIVQPGRTQACSAIAFGTENSSATLIGMTTDDDREPLLFWAGEKELSVDDPADVEFASMSLPGYVAGPVVAGDGGIWLASQADNSLTFSKFVDGVLLDSFVADNSALVGDMVPTVDGLLARVSSNDNEILARIISDGVMWETPNPMEIDGAEYWWGSHDLAVDEESFAYYGSGEVVVVGNISDGSIAHTIPTSSFNNNGDQVILNNGQVVVAPFGGDAWVEAYDASTGELAWTAAGPQDIPGVHDGKLLLPLGEGGVFVLSQADNDGIVAARIRLP